MKKLLLIISVAIFVNSVFGQSEGISYQAVIIDNEALEIPGYDVEGNYLSEGDVRLRFTIIDDAGDFEYQEVQQSTTDPYGMISLIIGFGEVTDNSRGAFDEIDWDGSPKQLHVELSYAGSGFQHFSDQELLFLPYVYHRNITATGTLVIDGSSTLNDSLTVENGSPTLLTGDLTVLGESQFEGDTYFNVIHVAYESYLNGDVFVEGVTTLNDSLIVANGSPTFLSGDLTVSGNSTFEGDNYFNTITVENESNLLGTLDVDSTTTLNHNFNVMQQSPSYLSGTLVVDEEVTFNSDFQVMNESPSFLSGSLEVDRISRLNDTLTVTAERPTLLSGLLNVEGTSTLFDSLEVNAPTTLNGQTVVNTTLSGIDEDIEAYPLRVEGSNQGIAIKVTASTPNRTNNFITFFDIEDEAIGRIEGQTAAERASSAEYIYNTAILTAEIGIAAINLVAASTSSTICVGLGGCVTAPVPSLVAAAVASQTITIANMAAYQTFAFTNLGVTYQSGSADYAEWLKRAIPSEEMEFGEIVSVNAGRITKNTNFGENMMVISFKPAVLGNMPPKGEEDAYEKVAFLGQVPVKVRGKVHSGDYILPSGMSDGTGIGVSPEDMILEDFSQIVGVSWSTKDVEGVGYVTVAIGMNENDLVDELLKLRSEVAQLRIAQSETDEILAELVPGFAERKGTLENDSDETTAEDKLIDSDREGKAEGMDLKELQEKVGAEALHQPLARSTVEDAIEILKNDLTRMGIDLETNPVYGPIFNDEQTMEDIIEQVMEMHKQYRQVAVEYDKSQGY